MTYTLILPTGEEIKFYIREVAEMYQTILGGRIVAPPELQLIQRKVA